MAASSSIAAAVRVPPPSSSSAASSVAASSSSLAAAASGTDLERSSSEAAGATGGHQHYEGQGLPRELLLTAVATVAEFSGAEGGALAPEAAVTLRHLPGTCPPRHSTRLRPLFLEFYGIL